MENAMQTSVDVNNQSANMNYTSGYDTNAGKFDNMSTWEKIWSASKEGLQSAFGMNNGKMQELQAVSTGIAKGTADSISNVKDITKYLAIAGIIVVGLIIYSKLK